MRKLAFTMTAGLLVLIGIPSAQQPDALQAAATTLNVANVKTLQLTGWGAVFNLGRNYFPSDPWPRMHVKNQKVSINYETASMRSESLREMGPVIPLGGGDFWVGETLVTHVVSGNDAWNEPPPQPGGAAGRAQPQPEEVPERRLALWSTPHGFIKAAMANKATLRKVPGGTEVSFMVDGKHKMVGIISSDNLVERVQTWFHEQPSVQANVPVNITVPDNVRGVHPPPVTVASKQLAEGIYQLTGGEANSGAIEMRDHIVMVDMPNGDETALAYMAKAKELIPNKPIRFVIVSHQHWDHAGGVRTAIDEGATLVTHEMHRPFLERVAKMPYTLEPDRLSKSRKAPRFQTVGSRGQLTDGNRTIDLYEVIGNIHSAGLLMAYLPKERVMFEIDVPGSAGAKPNTPLGPRAPSAAVLYDLIKRENLDPQVIMPFHGTRTFDMVEFPFMIGRSPAPS